ncbi:hypothetical protein [Actinacidiphila bryophytorum]|uniref:PknH-like extracellular domain-containing protein n=1 Tax=Actinacidiphila bryophytorum TaxID=1436133 RepID=A0A9W4MI66_9ACTN|nr:hypothetical protein [Actinacidiphila bryophytorum]MBM9435818.1 hypothetical protein [Actinacidiphila bryophytorum]MBN6543229.1 hypothetical protein [Actinacidiphila bryophytorum]CAG7650062.1 conserved exported hypothetical protein [Actinacidiphila bryophytorum]
MSENRSVQPESVRPESVRRRSVRRSRAAAAACFTAALVAVGVVGVQSAAAHPAARRPAAPVAAVAAPGLGSAALLQSEDFFQQGLAPVAATVALSGRQALSACSGEEAMRDLTNGKATAYASVTWTFDTDSSLLTESAASAATGTSAGAYVKRLDALVRDCQDEPAGHWHYGAAHTLTAGGGTGHWYPSYNGDGTATGGVAVLRSGTRVAVVELTGQPTDDPAYVEGVATAALNRLAS